jgi:hypothetical protein
MKRLGFLAVSACLVLTASCKDDADAEGGADESSSGETTSPPTTTSTTQSSSTTVDPTTMGCIAGSENCSCLEGECIGSLYCVDDSCVPGPEFQPDDDERMALAGLVVPVQIDVIADEFTWSQVSGPTVEWQGEGNAIQLALPPDAGAGEVVTMRISAIRNSVEATFDYDITVLDDVFEDFLIASGKDTEQVGTSVGLDFDDNGNMWVASSEGFISRFAIDNSFQTRYELESAAAIRWGRLYIPDSDDDIDVLYAAQTAVGAISAYNPINDSWTTITDQLEDMTPLGALRVVLPEDGDLLTIDPATSSIIRFSDDDGISRVLTTAVVGASALSFGPDANILYVGAPGQVWRVGLLQDGMTAEPELYVEFGDPMDPLQEVGGLAFDEGGNLWIGVPGASTAHIAHYVATGATDVVRSFSDVGAGISSFANLRYGNGDFSDSAIYWTNGSDRTVARIETGLQGM